MATLNERLVYLQTSRNKLKKDIANALSLSIMGYYRYENGDRQPTADIIIKLCKYYNISANFLLGLSDEEEPLNKEAYKNE